MAKIIAAVVLTMAMSSCVKFTDTLGSIQDAAIQARATFQPVVDGICRELAIQCRDEKKVVMVSDPVQQAACDSFEVCDQVREHMIRTFEHIQMLIADANMSYAIGDSKSADEAIVQAIALVQKIRDQLRHLGYIE